MALRRRLLQLLLVVIVLGTVVGASHDLLAALPLALVLLPIAWGRYVGERTIDRWRRERPLVAARRPRPAALAPVRPVLHALVPRGTALLAFHRAVRPPPARTLALR